MFPALQWAVCMSDVALNMSLCVVIIRVSSKSPGTSRKDYNILGDSLSSALDSNGHQEEKQGGSKVRWKNNVQDGEHDEDREDKGHARSTSLDLNKMLLADSNSDGVYLCVYVCVCVCLCAFHVCHMTMRTFHKELFLLCSLISNGRYLIFVAVLEDLPSAEPPKPPPVSHTLPRASILSLC